MQLQLVISLILLIVVVTIARRSGSGEQDNEMGEHEGHHRGEHGGHRRGKGRHGGHHRGKHGHHHRGKHGHRGKHHSFTKEVECQILLGLVGEDWTIPSCSDAVSKCFKESHKLAGICIRKEKTDAYVKNCQKMSEVKALKFEWFAKSCLWHQAIVNCSASNPIPESIATMAAELPPVPVARPENQYEARTANHECWASMEAKLEECNNLTTTECTNHFGMCSGTGPMDSSAPDLIKQWNEVAVKFQAAKTQKLLEFKQKIIECFSELPTPEVPANVDEAQSATTDSE